MEEVSVYGLFSLLIAKGLVTQDEYDAHINSLRERIQAQVTERIKNGENPEDIINDLASKGVPA